VQENEEDEQVDRCEDEDDGPSVIRFLVEKGADVNATDSYSTTPLHVCCMRGSLKSAKELLDCDQTDPMVMVCFTFDS
jgi:ankyrin repeat protein